MKQFKIIICSFILLALSMAVVGQSWDEKLGNREFDKFNFQKAALHYKDAFNKDGNNGYLAAKTADCYRLIHNWVDAEVWYAWAIDLGNTDGEVKMHYAMALMSNGDYSTARIAFEHYIEENPWDATAQEIYSNFDEIERLAIEDKSYKIQYLEVNTEASEFSPAFYDDHIVFVSNRDERNYVSMSDVWTKQQFFQLYTAVQDSGNTLINPNLFSSSDVNGRFHEGPLSFDKETNEMYFTRSNYKNKKATRDDRDIVHLKIFKKQLNEAGEGEKVLTEAFQYNSDDYSVAHPAVSADGSMLVFISDKDSGYGEYDLYVCRREGNGTWSQPENLGKSINSMRREMFPFLAADNTLYFASEGHIGLGGLDIYKAEYKNGKWETPENLGAPINSSRDDFGLILDEEGKYGYFTSNRRDFYWNDDIYSFTVDMKSKCIMAGIAYDKTTGDILSGAEIQLFDYNGEVLETLEANADGEYMFQLEAGQTYSITGAQQTYIDGKNMVVLNESCRVKEMKVPAQTTPADLSASADADVIMDLLLKKDAPLALVGTVYEKETGRTIPGVKVMITDLKKGEVIYEELSDSRGEIYRELIEYSVGDELKLEIRLFKKGYLPNTVQWSKALTEPGEHYVSFELLKLKVGMDLAKVIELKPIYFDLDKYNIREDAEIELNRILELMKEYPSMVIELSSHTDCRASFGYNEVLSSNRAKSSRQYLIDRGIEKDRIYGRGYGETRLTNDCKDGRDCSEDKHQQNRRTEFVIVKL